MDWVRISANISVYQRFKNWTADGAIGTKLYLLLTTYYLLLTTYYLLLTTFYFLLSNPTSTLILQVRTKIA
jgi:hypothetical protein